MVTVFEGRYSQNAMNMYSYSDLPCGPMPSGPEDDVLYGMCLSSRNAQSRPAVEMRKKNIELPSKVCGIDSHTRG